MGLKMTPLLKVELGKQDKEKGLLVRSLSIFFLPLLKLLAETEEMKEN